MDMFNHVNTRLTDTKRFYFFEYFYILLKSIDKYNSKKDIFESFKVLKDNLFLGESKYKKIWTDEELSEKQIRRYKYTFNEVIDETKAYNLIEIRGGFYELTKEGKKLLEVFETKGINKFIDELFGIIETISNGFYYFIDKLYQINPNGGMVIFPIYSPLKFQIQKSSIQKTSDIYKYLEILVKKIESDILVHLGRNVCLEDENKRLIARLIEIGMIKADHSELIKPESYNTIVKRIRDFWLNYFLKDVYGFRVSLSTFEIWMYRAKQVGVLNMTDFYPNFSGKIVYPTSILYDGEPTNDFRIIHKYPNKVSLYAHEPKRMDFEEVFVDGIYNSYNDLKRSNRSYFINLLDLSELVCYKLKLSYKTFADFLEYAYQLNLIFEDLLNDQDDLFCILGIACI